MKKPKAGKKPKRESLSYFLLRLFACFAACRWTIGKTDLKAWRMCNRCQWLLWVLNHSKFRWTRAYNKMDREFWRVRKTSDDLTPAKERQLCAIIRKHFPRPPKREDMFR